MARETTHIKLALDADLVHFIDALVAAGGGDEKNVHRATIVGPVLRAWMDSRLHENMMIERFLRGNAEGGPTHAPPLDAPGPTCGSAQT